MVDRHARYAGQSSGWHAQQYTVSVQADKGNSHSIVSKEDLIVSSSIEARPCPTAAVAAAASRLATRPLRPLAWREGF